MTGTAAGTDEETGLDSAVEADPSWWASPRVAIGAIVAAGLLALGLCLHQLSLPGVLRGVDEYDDGFYLGTVMRFVTGSVPYKDFVYPQPPGLPLLLAPLGLIGRVVGTRTLMVDVRILTAFVTAGNAALVAFLLRRRGIVPALFGGVALAVYPLAVTADKTLMLEPYLVFFSLLATCIMFRGDDLAGTRRLVLGGIVFGFACTVKLWAVLPAAVAIACCLPKWRRQVRPLVAGILAGSLIPTLPFFLMAPSDFVHDLVGIQFLRHHAPGTTSAADRLMNVTGIVALPSIHATHGFAFVLAAIVVVAVVVAFAAPMRRTRLDWFALGAGTMGFGAMFVSPDFHLHYTYFAAAFTALLLGVCVDRLARLAGSIGAARPGLGARSAPVAAGLAIVVIGAGCVWAIGQETRYDRENPAIITVGEVNPGVAAVIPAGSCTVADEVSRTLLTNRFVSHRSGCPTVVDTFSTWISYDPNTLPPSSGPYDRALVGAWRSWLAAADYAVFSNGRPFRIPWSPELEAWFVRHYRLVFQSPGTYVFRNVGSHHE